MADAGVAFKRVSHTLSTDIQPDLSGPIMLIGGGEYRGLKKKKLGVLSKLVELSGKENPLIYILTTATKCPKAAFKTYQAAFKAAKSEGVENVSCVHININKREDAYKPEYCNPAVLPDIIFITGGNQLRLQQMINGTPFKKFMDSAHGLGTVLAGSSAGMMYPAKKMICKDESRDEQFGIFKGGDYLNLLLECHNQRQERYEDGIIETRLTKALKEVNAGETIKKSALSIPENMGVILKNYKDMEVVGEGNPDVRGLHNIVTVIDNSFGQTIERKLGAGNVYSFGISQKYAGPEMINLHQGEFNKVAETSIPDGKPWSDIPYGVLNSQLPPPSEHYI